VTDKRTNPRFGPLALKTVFVANGQQREGYLTNVSVGGAFLAVDDPPQLGIDVDLTALLPWRLGDLRASGRVVWRHDAADGPPGLTGVGIAFGHLDEEAKTLLDRYLARFTELAARLDEPDEG
jgi:Tfp pilus assembly protein PilZ